MSLPAMLVGEIVGEMLQANQFARQILAVVDNKTKNTSADPKTPLTEHRKQRCQFLKSLMEKDDSKCGQNAVVERKTVLVPKSETIVHAIVRNVKTFDYQLSNGDMKPIKKGLNGLKTTRKQRSKGSK
ncbi:hypothetical protein E1A91_D11G210000v1 [Gossypium mustelinum]|uniref:Uncharacterized protein n=1 Tax=Gossypium mustelinum TaxID=34275 RepID=A0A5D2SWR6_GOSMU|nr:hypothetical protein E1A91_D11G210000v1 [Gossypium mustelinum]